MKLNSWAMVAIFGLSMATLLASTPVMAESMAQAAPNQPQMNDRSERMFKLLNLTSEQQQKIQEIRQEYQGQIRQQQEQMRQLQQELNGLMANNAPESELRQKHDQFMALKQQMGDIQFNMMLKTREILTAEQRSQLTELMQERRQNLRRDR
ncbi:MAG TPA: Spy/CpxP family protein refolding chaperone [Candidatus Obscuribacterales bacterium]